LDLIDVDDSSRNLHFFLSAHDDPLLGSSVAAGLLASEDGGPDPSDPGASLPGLDAEWSYIHGIITVAADGSFLHYGPPVDGDPDGAKPINQNLGANEAAFAIYNKTLSDLVLDPGSGYEHLTIDMRLARINNGFEQAFILPMVNIGDVVPPVVPEAGSLAMWSGLTLTGVGGIWLQRKRRS
jgi:hypothetical protein